MEVVDVELKLALDMYRDKLKFNLSNKSQERRQVLARYAFMAAARATTEISLKKIGRLFHKDHATVIHGVSVVEQARDLKDEISVGVVDNFILAKNTILNSKGKTDKVILDNIEKQRLYNRIDYLSEVVSSKDDKIDSLNQLLIKKNKEIVLKNKELNKMKEDIRDLRLSKTEPELKRINSLSEKFLGY